jgi:hypothetical protein
MPYSNYTKAFASYLAKTFYPTFVSINVKNINRLNYKNKLFSIYYNSEFKDITYNSALTNYNHKYSFVKFLNTPESFIKQIIDNNSNNRIPYNQNNDVITFNTNGIIPIRYLDMISDFSDCEIKYNKPNNFDIKLQEEYIINKIANLSDYMLHDIYRFAEYLSSKQYDYMIEVIKAPSYQCDDVSLKKYYVNSFRCPLLDEDAKNEIINRVWHSGDGDMSSPSTKIFFKKSQKYKSLGGIGYSVLFSSSGGIDMSYCDKLPWFELKKNLNDRQTYYEVSSYHMYKSCEISATEIAILQEILKQEKAEFTSKISFN